jgi:radical SAM superfamily enzyme YgiQ (UPF0313 family)
MRQVIDPPYGWMYGFPKAIPSDVKDTKKWLVENGYPQKIIDEYGDSFYCRHWMEREDDK